MTTEYDDTSFEPPHTSSPTDHVLTELQLYGYRPFQDEPDPRPIPDAQIVAGAVADIFDALAARRPYRDAMPVEKVFGIIRKDAPRSLDGRCVEALVTAGADLASLSKSLQELSQIVGGKNNALMREENREILTALR